MIDLPELPSSVGLVLRLVVITVAAVASYLLVRAAVQVGERHIVDRRRAEAGGELVTPEELERRVGTIGRLLVRVAGAAIAVIAGLMVLDLFGIDIGPAVAGLGVAGIAVGFGAQTLVRDWLAGIFIVLENQYSAGDVVRIAGIEGTVEDISLRRTTVRDLDGTVHSVPNGQITVASNLTRLWARVNLDISVTYDNDIDRASAIIDGVGAELLADPEWGPRLLEPPKVIRVGALSDSAVSLKVLGQVRPAEQWAVSGELRKRILAAFGAAGIRIPSPDQPAGPGEAASGQDAASGPAGPPGPMGG
jgi:moderate conductance mechanosensitive channel